MHHWLENFAYRINIGIGIFLTTIVAAEVLAWISVGYEAVKAAVVDPVKSLRRD
jgi:hypothetical protein